MDKYFEIKNYDDIYRAVGEIIKHSQEWEDLFKKLAILLNVSVKNVNNSSLNKLNEALKKEECISKKEFKLLKKVIKKRNYINHTFFLDVSLYNSDSTNDQYYVIWDFSKIEILLNDIVYNIFEASDFIANKIDIIEKRDCLRPTEFDFL